MSARVMHDGRGGFALVLVVFMLFAVAVAGITGYQVVNNEMTLATQNRDSQAALAVSRAGLQRFIGETIGQVGDSVSYAIGSGVATVTTRKVAALDSRNHLYYIESTGTIADARTPDTPAKRTVATYAWHRLYPIPSKAALWQSSGATSITNTARVRGADEAVSGECTGAPSSSVAGIVRGGGGVHAADGGSYTGTPNTVDYWNYTATYDSVGIRWDILKSSSFPVDFQGYSPGYIAPDSFPIVRYNGDLWAWGGSKGQGVLIVTGTLWMLPGFNWTGIVLAGTLGDVSPYWGSYAPEVHGMIIGGMENTGAGTSIGSGKYYYNSCDALGASKSLSYLDVVGNTIFEVNG